MHVMVGPMTVRAIVSKYIPLVTNENVVVILARLDEGIGSLAAQDLELLVDCDPNPTEALDLSCDRYVATCWRRKRHTIREHKLSTEELLHPRLVDLHVVGVPGRSVPIPRSRFRLHLPNLTLYGVRKQKGQQPRSLDRIAGGPAGMALSPLEPRSSASPSFDGFALSSALTGATVAILQRRLSLAQESLLWEPDSSEIEPTEGT